jgi:AcrR family transcriptional regulator
VKRSQESQVQESRVQQSQIRRPQVRQAQTNRPPQSLDQASNQANPAEKSSYHHGDLRQSLIDATIALLQEGELSQLSLREVARRVGVSHNAPYRHFQDKEALLSAVAEQGFQGLCQATQRALAGLPPNPVQQLSAIGTAYVKFAVQQPVYYRVMFSSTRNRQDKALETAIEQSSAILSDVIQAGQADGSFRADDLTLMVQVAWAFVHGIAMLAIEGQLPAAHTDSFDQFLEASSHLLIQGFAVADGMK